MKKISLAFLLMFGISNIIFAQAMGEIKGKIVDKTTNLTIPGATIYVEVGDQKVATSSDSKGNFVIKPLNPGVYNVFVSFIGYQSRTISNVIVNPDKFTPIDNICLSNKAVDIKNGPVITAFGNRLIKPEDPSNITILPAQISDLVDSKNISSIIRNMSSEIKVSDNGDEIYFRGSRSGDVAYIVDGCKQINGDMGIPSTAIGSVTVYTGGVPAKYGDFTGGVVVIETKSYFDWLNEQRAKEMRKSSPM
ncbi:MAG: carboxypeptidase regulatory-like domain-containing protein [Bacteroidetes bacterium]|nr:carboxypeptidase regulatory-like domain-containing protein [Bacteroidota bacterium]